MLDVRIAHDMPHEDYLAADGLSFSQLKRLMKSPAHFHALTIAKDRPPSPEPSPQMFAGTLLHCALLEPEAFPLRYAVGPKVKSRAVKEWTQFEASLAPGIEAVTPLQKEIADAQRAAALRDPKIAALFDDGDAEVSIFWTDERTGVRMKARLDWLAERGRAGEFVIAADVKTAVDASPDGFARAVWNFRYDMQAAHYMRAARAATGKEVAAFVFVAVESEFPYVCAPYMLSRDFLDLGAKALDRAVDTYVECTLADEWPGYSLTGTDDIQTLEAPKWAK